MRLAIAAGFVFALGAQARPADCSALPTLVRGTLLAVCQAGICAEDGRTVLRSTRPIRQILPGPAAGVIAVHVAGQLDLWLGDTLTPILELGSTSVEVRPALTEQLALARRDGPKTMVSILSAGREEATVVETTRTVIDFACAAGRSCVLLVAEPNGAPKVYRFEDGRAIDWGGVASARRIFWSNARPLLQIWDGKSVHQSQYAGVWVPVADVQTHQNCPVFDPETGLLAVTR